MQKSGSVGRPLQRLIRGGVLFTFGRVRKRVPGATAQEPRYRGHVGKRVTARNALGGRNPREKVVAKPRHIIHLLGARSRSSAGQSTGFLNRGSQVRALPGSPRNTGVSSNFVKWLSTATLNKGNAT